MMTDVASTWISRVALLSVSFLWAVPSWANHIENCGQACAINCATAGYTEPSCQTASSGFCLVEDDISCSSSDTGVGLYQGTDLRFERGRKLICANDDCPSAVKIKGEDSEIYTETGGTGTALGGTDGGFNFVIDCGGWDDSVVDRVQLTGGTVSVHNCETVTDNILEGFDRTYLTVNQAISWTKKVNSGTAADKASGNLISDKVWAISATGSGTKVAVEDNHIMTTNKSSVVFTKDANATWNAVRDNVLHGSGDSARTNFLYGVDPVIFSGPTTGATATNDCSIDDHPGCAACISAGVCLDYIPQ